eukprot:s2628_g6.t1
MAGVALGCTTAMAAGPCPCPAITTEPPGDWHMRCGSGGGDRAFMLKSHAATARERLHSATQSLEGMEAYRSELTEALQREGSVEVAALAAWTLAEEQGDEEQQEIMSQQRLVQEATWIGSRMDRVPDGDADASIDLHVIGLDGSSLDFRVSEFMTGLELGRLVKSQLPGKLGAKIQLHHGAEMLKATNQIWLEPLPGIPDTDVTLTYAIRPALQVFVPASVHAAWQFLKGFPVDEEELALQGVTALAGIEFEDQLIDLPETLETWKHWHLGPILEKMPKLIEIVYLRMSENRFHTLQLGFESRNFQPFAICPMKSQRKESLTFRNSFNESIVGVLFPNSLKNLTFGYRFNQSLAGTTLPSELETLTFGQSFNQGLEDLTFPQGLQMLTFGQYFDRSLERVDLPRGLQSLTFGHDFNQSLEGVHLPDGLKHLVFGDSFDQSLQTVDLPSGLESLTLGEGFGCDESSMLGTLPKGLKQLTCNIKFVNDVCLECLEKLHSLTFKGWSDQDKEFDTLALPSSLKSLSFADGVNHLERMNLPRGLQLLLLGDSLGEVPLTLPDELQSLSFGKRFNESIQNVIFPNRLQLLNFGDKFNQNLDGILLPENLQSLTFGAHFNQSLEFVTLPMCLVSLTFGARFNQSLERVNLPVQLHSLTLGDEYDQTLEHVTLPEGLQELVLGDLFNQTLDGVVFPQLQRLKLSRRFNENVDAVSFPRDLRILTFGDYFNQPLEHVSFPPGLQHLAFGDYFNQSLEKVNLPPDLQSLTLGLAFDQALPTWPELRELTFCGQNYHGIENIQLPSTLQELRCDGLWEREVAHTQSLLNETILKQKACRAVLRQQRWTCQPGQDVLDNPEFFSKNNITCVLSLGPAAPGQRIRLVAREHINLPDIVTADLSCHFTRIVRFIAGCRHNGHVVYVHCAAGISRSSTSVIAYLMSHLNLTFEQCLTFVSAKRPAICPNDGFQRQLRRFETSNQRKQLAQEMRNIPNYEEIQKHDLDLVSQAVTNRLRSRSEARTPPTADARQRALQAVQNTAMNMPRQQMPRLGDGAQQGDVGLAWLLPRRRSSSTSTATSASLPPSTRSQKPARPFRVGH